MLVLSAFSNWASSSRTGLLARLRRRHRRPEATILPTHTRMHDHHYIDRPRQPEAGDLDLHRVRMPVLRLADLDLPGLQGKSLVGPLPHGRVHAARQCPGADLRDPAGDLRHGAAAVQLVLRGAGAERRPAGQPEEAARLARRHRSSAASSSSACRCTSSRHFFHEGLGYSTNLFGATFYTLTGFHGTHVTLGVIWLIVDADPGAAGASCRRRRRSTSRSRRCTGTSSTWSGS